MLAVEPEVNIKGVGLFNRNEVTSDRCLIQDLVAGLALALLALSRLSILSRNGSFLLVGRPARDAHHNTLSIVPPGTPHPISSICASAA